MKIKRYILWSVFMIGLDLIWSSNMNAYWIYTPHFFLFVLLFFPFDKPGWLQLTAGFLTGIIADIIFYSGGLFTASSVTFMLLRFWFFRIVNGSRNRVLPYPVHWRMLNLSLYILFSAFIFENLVYFFDFSGITYWSNHFSEILPQSLSTAFFIWIVTFLFLRHAPGQAAKSSSQ